MNLHKLFLNFREFCISFAEVFLSLSLSESLHTFVIRRIKRESRVCSNWAALQAGGRQPQKSVHCAQSFKTFCSWQRLSKQRSAAPKMSIAQIACAHTKWKEAKGREKGKERAGERSGRRAIAHNSQRWRSSLVGRCGKNLTKLMCQISRRRAETGEWTKDARWLVGWLAGKGMTFKLCQRTWKH